MMNHTILGFILCFMLTSPCHGAEGNPHACEGMVQTLSVKEKQTLTPILIQQLSKTVALPTTKIRIQKALRYQEWNLLYIDTYVSDSVYMFFSGDPLTTPLITIFGGSASPDEYKDIVDWAKNNVPGIPDQLVGCFAHYVTTGGPYP